MPVTRQDKTNFTGGEIAPDLLGRGDLKAFDNGARTLTNVFIDPTGGLSRRAGPAAGNRGGGFANGLCRLRFGMEWRRK